jgi:hypothetical protein
MELSPLAREKLAQIGELTEEEKSKLKYSRQLTSLLAEYFTNELNPDGLWKELKRHKDEGRGFMLKDTQSRMLESMRLSSSEIDIQKLCRGLLAAESLKDDGDYAGLEHELQSIEDLRRQYGDERNKTYEKIKANIEKQVKLAAQKLAGQAAVKGTAIDVDSSVEATAKASPEWKSFVTKHENTYEQKFKELITRIRRKLDV